MASDVVYYNEDLGPNVIQHIGVATSYNRTQSLMDAITRVQLKILEASKTGRRHSLLHLVLTMRVSGGIASPIGIWFADGHFASRAEANLLMRMIYQEAGLAPDFTVQHGIPSYD